MKRTVGEGINLIRILKNGSVFVTTFFLLNNKKLGWLLEEEEAIRKKA